MIKTFHFPKWIMKLLIVFSFITIVVQVLLPRTSLHYRNWFYYPVFGDYLTHYDEVLLTGEQFYLRVKNINTRLSYRSTDYKVAYANNLGRVTAYRPGVAYIHVTAGDKDLVCRVRVIALNHKALNLSVGETEHLKVKGSRFFVSYESKDPTIASVNWLGRVKAIAPGTAEIRVTAKGRTMSCFVTVSQSDTEKHS